MGRCLTRGGDLVNVSSPSFAALGGEPPKITRVGWGRVCSYSVPQAKSQMRILLWK